MAFRKKMLLSLLLLLAVIPLAVACGTNSSTNTGSSSSSQSPCDKSSAIKGSIQSIAVASGKMPQGTQIQGSIFLDGTHEQNAQYDKVSVVIAITTQIFEKSGQTCQAVPFSALQAGKRVQVQSTGPVTQSYPPQLTATEVVILPALSQSLPLSRRPF